VANILILDEPTGVLTPQESKELFGVSRPGQDGKTIIFISHKLREVARDLRPHHGDARQVVGHLVSKDTASRRSPP